LNTSVCAEFFCVFFWYTQKNYICSVRFYKNPLPIHIEKLQFFHAFL
jgi:hypothetical protein